MSVLHAREGYALWAPRYDVETVVSFLDHRLVAELEVPTAGRVLLDVGCGTARRLRDASARMAVGIDLTPEMLARAAANGVRSVAVGDVRALPVAGSSFDVVWCRLVVGHVRELDAAYAELARVSRAGGTVIVSDVSAEAVAAGHRRTFRDERGVVREVEHFVHTVPTQIETARRVGLELVAERTGVVDESVLHFYADAGRLGAYEQRRGLPLVIALAFRKT